MFSPKNIYGPSFIDSDEIASGVIAVAIFLVSIVSKATIARLPTIGLLSVSTMVDSSISYLASPIRHSEAVLLGSS